VFYLIVTASALFAYLYVRGQVIVVICFLALPIPYIQWVTLVAELTLALWLLVVGVNEAKWRAHIRALQNGSSVR